MQSAEILSNTDRTSWRRIKMFVRFLWPSLRPMVILYPILAIVVTLMVNFFFSKISYEWAMQVMSIITFAVILAPTFLCRQANKEMFYSLPVLGYEKCEAIFGIMFVGMFCLFIPAKLCGIHIKEEFAMEVINRNLSLGSTESVVAMSLLSTFAGEALTLWTVFAARSNRAVKSIIAGLSTLLFDGILGFFVGFFTAISGGDIETSMEAAAPIIITFWAICFVFFTYKASRAIARKQI